MTDTSHPPDAIEQPEGHNAQGYQVQLSTFEGPMDLLLHLIEREELDITKVALAQVTDQYLAYLAILKQIEAEFLTDFLVVAARLLFIKSRYKQFKMVAGTLRQRETDGLRNYIRVALPPKLEPKLSLGDVTLDELIAAVRQALEVRPPEPAVGEVVSPMTVTIGEQMTFIRDELTHRRQISFQGLLRRATSRVEIIVTFLAVLELIKQYVVEVQQDSLFGDIVISPGRTDLQGELSSDTPEEARG
jgi:segregation and condensation protein A